LSRSLPYCDGFREASKLAVELLHDLHAEMNDPHAKRVLDSAAFSIGNALKKRLEAMGGELEK
jgi:hypothetical protein